MFPIFQRCWLTNKLFLPFTKQIKSLDRLIFLDFSFDLFTPFFQPTWHAQWGTSTPRIVTCCLSKWKYCAGVVGFTICIFTLSPSGASSLLSVSLNNKRKVEMRARREDIKTSPMCNMEICTAMVNEVKSNAIHQTIRHHSFMNLLLRYKNKRLLVAKLPIVVRW